MSSHHENQTIRTAALVVALLSPVPAAAQQPDRAELLRLHQELIESVFLRSDTTLIAALALPNLIVIPPGGVVENRAQVIRGVPNVRVDSIHIEEVTVADHGTTAVVVARLRRASPPAAGIVGPGRSRMMSVFVYDQEQWRLLARSITPCIERAVAVGRC